MNVRGSPATGGPRGGPKCSLMEVPTDQEGGRRRKDLLFAGLTGTFCFFFTRVLPPSWSDAQVLFATPVCLICVHHNLRTCSLATVCQPQCPSFSYPLL